MFDFLDERFDLLEWVSRLDNRDGKEVAARKKVGIGGVVVFLGKKR